MIFFPLKISQLFAGSVVVLLEHKQWIRVMGAQAAHGDKPLCPIDMRSER